MLSANPATEKFGTTMSMEQNEESPLLVVPVRENVVQPRTTKLSRCQHGWRSTKRNNETKDLNTINGAPCTPPFDSKFLGSSAPASPAFDFATSSRRTFHLTVSHGMPFVIAFLLRFFQCVAKTANQRRPNKLSGCWLPENVPTDRRLDTANDSENAQERSNTVETRKKHPSDRKARKESPVRGQREVSTFTVETAMQKLYSHWFTFCF